MRSVLVSKFPWSFFLVGTFVILFLLPGSAIAKVSESVVHQYERDFDVPQSVAEKNLETQERGSAIVGQLKAVLGEKYGGVWFDNRTGEFVIPLLNGASKAAVQSLLAGKSLEGQFRTVPAANSWTELEAVQQQLDRSLTGQLAQGLVQTSVDPRSNSVVIRHTSASDNASKATIEELVETNPSQIKLEFANIPRFNFEPLACKTSTPRACGRPLRGGVSLTRNTGEIHEIGECSVGFKAMANGNRYVLTAGHCVTAFSKWGSEDASGNFHAIGNAASYNFPGGDWAKISANGSSYWDWTPWPSQVAHYWEDQERTIDYESWSYLGEYVCHSGTKTGTSCGEVSALNVASGYGVNHLTEVHGVCAIGGDSGGPVFDGHTALGLVSGGDLTFPECERPILYTEITEVTDALGVSVGTRIGGPPAPPPATPPVRASFVDAGNANTVTAWEYGNSGWQQTFLWGHPAAAGTKPFIMKYEGTTHIFFVDASRGNQITEWSWNSTTGWQQAFLTTDPVAAGSNLTGFFYSGYPYLFFSDAATNRSVTAVVRVSPNNWAQVPFYGDPVASNSSPSAIVHNGQTQVYFADSAKGNTLAAWTWNSVTGWQQAFFYGDTIATNSSPSAISNGSAQIYFVDASKGKTISAWVWGGTLQQVSFYGDTVASNSSPAAIANNGQAQVYFANASQGNTIAVWTWGATLKQSTFYGDTVASNSSPAAIPNGGTPQVFFADETTNNSVALWQWGSTLQQIRLFGHPLVSGGSPST